jgi:hypothetical protein
MAFGLSVALALLAPAASAQQPDSAPAAAEPPTTAPTPAGPNPPAARCSTPGPNDREIVICAERPHGYRIDPDVRQAVRARRSGGRPTRPGPGGGRDTSCTVVGPFACGPSAGVNLVSAVGTLATMASRVAKGEEIGSMFVTDPNPSEYQLYREAKQAREAKEAEAKAKVEAKAKAEAAAAGRSDSAGNQDAPR